MLGLTNWLGFGFYVLSVLFTNSLVLAINAESSPSKYFISPSPPSRPLSTSESSGSTSSKNSKVKVAAGGSASLSIDPRSGSFSAQDVASFLVNGLTENAFSFILWWTFWFGIVHGRSQISPSVFQRMVMRANTHRATDSFFGQCTTEPRRLESNTLGSQQLRIFVDTLDGNRHFTLRRPALRRKSLQVDDFKESFCRIVCVPACQTVTALMACGC